MSREKRSHFQKSASWRVMIVLSSLFLVVQSKPAAADPPAIDVWYGDEQHFGHLGSCQRYVNILGNVQKGSADSMLAFYYTLNGISRTDLSIGADDHRLVSNGDFNIDIKVEDLINGTNKVIITAINSNPAPNTTYDTVTVHYSAGNVWPLPYTAVWDTADQIEDVAQVLDGVWEIQPGGTVRTIQVGYDRLIAIGDTLWGDYEVTAPLTFHSFDSLHGVGFLFRWISHTDSSFSGWQPNTGRLPYGAICWYRPYELMITGNNNSTLDSKVWGLYEGVTYMFKARVKTIPGVGGRYSFKVWEQGLPEPSAWDLTGQEELSDPQFGSILLIAHNVDVSFGTVLIEPVETSLYDIVVQTGLGNTSATVTWSTNQPANSSVAYGLTTGYEGGTELDPSMVAEHSITLNDLTPDTLYHFQISSTDRFGYTAMSSDSIFTTSASGLLSDDFSSSVLDPMWTFVDPKGDGMYKISRNHTIDSRVEIHVPGGSGHELWNKGVQAPHIIQSVNNTDFEIEVKFDSPLNMQYQQQGFIIKQDSLTFIRFEFYSTTVSTKVFAATVNNLSPETKIDTYIGGINIKPLYMRVKRTGDYWEQFYSLDGNTWLAGADFTFDLNVSGVGVYAGNAQLSGSPEHTSYIDYFFNTDSPIDPEDGFVTATGPELSMYTLELLPNRPNPFNPVTLIRYVIAHAGPAQVDIYDIDGRKVRTLVNEWKAAGMQSVHWEGLDANGTPVASGVYFIRLVSQGEIRNRKIVLLK